MKKKNNKIKEFLIRFECYKKTNSSQKLIKIEMIYANSSIFFWKKKGFSLLRWGIDLGLLQMALLLVILIFTESFITWIRSPNSQKESWHLTSKISRDSILILKFVILHSRMAKIITDFFDNIQVFLNCCFSLFK